MKNLKSLGKTLNKKQQQEINGGFSNDPFIGSPCYTQRRFCNAALSSAISNGADPTSSHCFSCTTLGGGQGWQVRVFGSI